MRKKLFPLYGPALCNLPNGVIWPESGRDAILVLRYPYAVGPPFLPPHTINKNKRDAKRPMSPLDVKLDVSDPRKSKDEDRRVLRSGSRGRHFGIVLYFAANFKHRGLKLAHGWEADDCETKHASGLASISHERKR